ncbi:MAG: hypothetical protein H8K08_08545 [Nitrospira sp.]|nr:hypothetical protein [Nitrospira sp.]
MLKKVLLWSFILLPSLMAGALLVLLASAAWIIVLLNDPQRFAKASEPLQTLAREVYERQRHIWQAQSKCIMFDEVLFYKPRPGQCVFNNLEYATVLTFDSRGFRESSQPGQQTEQSAPGRIVVLGDSQAMGWGVQDRETFSSVLASEHGFQVFNLAVSSYGTARELLRLRREFELQAGDIVVIQYHPNDLEENLAFLKPGGLPPRSPVDLGRLAHTAQDYGVLQVSASVGFILKGQFIEYLFGDTKQESLSDEFQVQTFLSVVERFPELEKVRLVVCEVDNFGHISEFPEILEQRSGGRITVLHPRWESSDFFRLDNHLNAEGHRKLAGIVAAAVLSGRAVN